MYGMYYSRSLDENLEVSSLVGPWNRRTSKTERSSISAGLQRPDVSNTNSKPSSNTLDRREESKIKQLARGIVYRSMNIILAKKMTEKNDYVAVTEDENENTFKREVRPTRPRGLWGRKDPSKVLNADKDRVKDDQSLVNQAWQLQRGIQIGKSQFEIEVKRPPGLWGREKDNQ